MRQQNNEKIRSSHRRCSIKKVLLKNLGKFTGKHLRRSLIFNKSAGLLPATLFEKKFRHRYLSMNFEKFLILFRMGIFEAAHGWGEAKKAPSLKSVTNTLQWWNLEKIQKIYESRDTPPEFCWHQNFFTGNQLILLYQEIQI